MLVPSCFHGLIKDVKRETMKVARKLLSGKSLDEAVAAYEMLDTAKMLDSYYYISLTHQHCAYPNAFHFPYLLWNASRIIMDKLGDNFSEYSTYEQRIFEELLKKEWSVLCLGGDGASYFANMALVHDEHTFDNRTRWLPYIKAVERYWNSYASLRNVEVIKGFVDGDNTVWENFRELHFILANLGIPDEELRRPLPGMDLKKLIDDYGVFDVDINRLPWRQGLNIPILEKKLGEKNV